MRPKKKAKNQKWQKLTGTSLSLGRFLVDQLLEIGYLLPQPFETPYQHRRRLEGWPSEVYCCRVREEFKRLKKHGWIIEAEEQGKKFLKLTKKGRLQAFYYKLQALKHPPKKIWDGKWRLAIFDIPEKGRRERDAIRGILKIAGFYQLQKSVYIYPHEIPGEIITYLKESGLLPFIRFARVDKMDDTKDLQRYFKL